MSDKQPETGCPDHCGAAEEAHCWNTSEWADAPQPATGYERGWFAALALADRVLNGGGQAAAYVEKDGRPIPAGVLFERLRGCLRDLGAKRLAERGPEAVDWLAYADISAERERQIGKGRTPEKDDARDTGDWFACLALVAARTDRSARATWVKLGSVAVAAIQSIDRLAARGQEPK